MVWRDSSGRPVEDVRDQVTLGLIDGEKVIGLIVSNAGTFTPKELHLANEVLATIQALREELNRPHGP